MSQSKRHSQFEDARQETLLERELQTGKLSLRGYGIDRLPDELWELDHLYELDLARNSLPSLPDRFDALPALAKLHLNENQLKTLPASIGTLKNLQFLDVGLNHLSALPPEIGALRNLLYLRIGPNDFSNFPSGIGGLSALQTLIANSCLLDVFPHEIARLTNLKSLNLASNRLNSLPFSFTNLTRLNRAVFDKNPLKQPPPEIVARGPGAIINYLHAFDRDAESFTLREAKLLIVGQGAVGKSYLMKRLVYDRIDEDAVSTEGIDITSWDLPAPDNKQFRVNFWDFGGQEIYHSTHQFFLTKRSLYMLVWDARKEDNLLSFDYWLNVIRLLSDSSPVLVIQSKSDERIKMIDEVSLKEKFPNIIGFYRVSATVGTGIQELREEVGKRVVALEHVGDVLPRVWNDIRTRLRALDKNFIDYSDYLAICAQFGLDEEKANYLSQYYHDLGVFLHFQDNAILKGIVFLKPEWATNAVYKIVDTKEVQQAFGRFDYAGLQRIWSDYPQDKYGHLLELMKKFEICFQIPDTDTYIVPELLSTQRPFFQWPSKNNLHFEYRYEFMPSGIITRFIVRTHDLIRGDLYWKNGVLLGTGGSRALVISDPLNRRIKLQIHGREKRVLLGIIRREIDYIHNTLNDPNVAAMVPCVCAECSQSVDPYLHDFEYLKKAKAKRKWRVECKKSFDDVEIDAILGEIKEQKKAPGDLREIHVYGDYYEAAVGAVTHIKIKDVKVNTTYSDEIYLHTGVDRQQFNELVRGVVSLGDDAKAKLNGLVTTFKKSKDKLSVVERIKEFLARHQVPVVQNLSASALIELFKYLF